MVMAFDNRVDGVETTRMMGQIYEIGIPPDHFNGMVGDNSIEDPKGIEPATLNEFFIFPIDRIAEEEQPRIVRGALFHCDVELIADGEFNIRSVEFFDEPPLDVEAMKRSGREFAALQADVTVDEEPFN